MNGGVAVVIGLTMLAACGSGGEGDRPTAVGSEPWRVVVDDHQMGGPVDPGIRTATDAEMFDELWTLWGRDGDQPAVDFKDEVVIAHAMSYPSGCEFPFIGLVMDDSDATITANFAGNEPAECADDENQYLVIIGIDRDALTDSRYELTTSISGQTATLEL